MKTGRRFPGSGGLSIICLLTAFCAGLLPSPVHADTCVLPPQHAGVTFPVERVDPDWVCRLQSIVDDYTTANKIGPIRSALPESMYLYLLDRPPLAAALIDRLELGLYRAETRGPGRYWGSDGEGIQGIVQLVYQDPTSRIYYLEGSHKKRFLPHITGKAVVLLRMSPVKEPGGAEAMDSTMVSYTKLDNRILSGLVSLLRPLIGGTVTRKLAKGVDVVNRLGQEMHLHPDRVLAKAADPPPLPEADIAFLKGLLGSPQHPGASPRTKTTTP
ncbi:MAG TPA: hypothetical protein VKP13_15475 [Nitrospira sp.]|nr:hypothetical protein [Nitrospira sp.]